MGKKLKAIKETLEQNLSAYKFRWPIGIYFPETIMEDGTYLKAMVLRIGKKIFGRVIKRR